MINLEKRKNKKSFAFTFPVLAAQKFIRLFKEIKNTNEEQKAMLAAAHYTLATLQNISTNQNKMHINAAIALLKKINMNKRKDNWNSQIAHAYFKRAELLEEKNTFTLAIEDYNQVIFVLEENKSATQLDDEDRLLLAQSAISIADLIVNEQITDKTELPHSLFYINKSLEHLAKISNYDDDVLITEAYAHQIAGLALSHHFEEAKEAFRIALLTAFRTETLRIFPLLADIYTCLGLLYEQHYQRCPIQKTPTILLDQAMIYFNLSLLFNPSELEEKEDSASILESLFEMVYRILDPYLPSLPYQVTCDVIDALIYIYIYNLDNTLPNQELTQQLKEPETLDAYAQHLYWLVVEAYRKKHPRTELYEMNYPSKMDIALETSDILNKIQNIRMNNVYYLKNRFSASKGI